MCNAIPYSAMDEDLRDQIWDDGLHLTEDGYRMMGDVISSRLFELLETCNQPMNIGKPISSRLSLPVPASNVTKQPSVNDTREALSAEFVTSSDDDSIFEK